MGNKVSSCGLPVVSMHHGDGRVSHYLAPITVKDILVDHPDYFVVEINNGKKNILNPKLELQPGGNYYLLPPPRLFSTTALPSRTCNCCCTCSHLPQVISTYFAATTDPKSSIVTRSVEDYQAVPGQRPTDANGLEIPSLASLLAPEGASIDIILSRVGSRRSRNSEESTAKDSPRSSLEMLIPRKIVWLEDMIRGAENQWRRMQQERMLKSKKSGLCNNPALPNTPTQGPEPTVAVAVSKPIPARNWRPSLERIDECMEGGLRVTVDSRQALRWEIEEMEQLEQRETDESNKQSLRLKIDALEQRVLMRSEPSLMRRFQCVGNNQR